MTQAVPTLNPEQQHAVTSMAKILLDKSSPTRFMLLKGPAGTGKTFCIRQLVNLVKGRIVYTAPTNKATRVLRETLRDADHPNPECRTIFSLLGLKLQPNGEVKELAAPDEDVDLTNITAVVLDEAYMASSMVCKYLVDAAKTFNFKVIAMGDHYQLPPVGEDSSPIESIAQETFELTKVMRFDNQILNLAVDLRQQMSSPAPRFKRDFGNDAGEGVWDLDGRAFLHHILDTARAGQFTDGEARVISWRNVQVDLYNQTIRSALFHDSAKEIWLPDDRFVLTAPAANFDGEVIAHTDEDGRVARVDIDWHPVYGEFKCWRLSVVTSGNQQIALWTLHQDSERLFMQRTEELAAKARANRRAWGAFWEFKEAFHQVRHGYAITAHRSQGSTYHTVFADWRDILGNRNKLEAYKCLYVACTRAKKRLYLGGM